MNNVKDVLADILAEGKTQLAADKARVSFLELSKKAEGMPTPVDFYAAVTRPGCVSVIAEMKRKSPSAGLIRDPYNVKEIATAYKKAGVAALSVLTEQGRFNGKIDDIDAVHASVDTPILRKDFLFDPYQVAEARVHGASAVLLIADMVTASQLKQLVTVATEFQLTSLVEVFTKESVKAALASGSKLIGINTRNLRTLEMVPDNVEKLSKLIPNEFAIVAESGIKTAKDIKKYKDLNIKAVLVGESLLKQKDLESAARTLVEAGK